MEGTWTLKMHCFGVLKSYEFIEKTGFGQHERLLKNTQFVNNLLLFKKHVLLQPMVLSQQKLDL